MYQQFLSICSDVITIGGAVSVVLLVILLFFLIRCVRRISRFVEEINQNYDFVKNVLTMPFSYLMKFFK